MPPGFMPSLSLGGAPLPPLDLGSSAQSSARSDVFGNSWSLGSGDWIVNQAGSGTSLQGAAASVPTLAIIALIGIAAVWLLKK